MNPRWFGDSYDVVKRFFVGALRELGYDVYVDPMPTGNWEAIEAEFLAFLRARHLRDYRPGRTALLLDPDTGIGRRAGMSHTTLASIADLLASHEIVFVFDQAFSRGRPLLPQLKAKLSEASGLGFHAFYYNSHAHFFFASGSPTFLIAVREALLKCGLPADRLLLGPSCAA